MRPALDFLDGDRSPETLDALAAGLRAWAAQEGAGAALPVGRMIGLPASPRAAKRALRNKYLSAAAAHLLAEIRRDERYDCDDTITAVAQRMANAAETLESSKWDTWRLFSEPPAHADAVDRAMWSARRLNGKPLPKTERAYRNVLRAEATTAKCFPISRKAPRTA